MIKKRPSFISVIEYLLGTGMSQTDIHKKTGVHQPTISAFKNGIDKPNISYVHGDALMQFYEQERAKAKHQELRIKRRAGKDEKVSK